MCLLAVLELYLSELSNIADTLALHGAEVSGDTARLEVDNTSEGLVQKGANRRDREVASFSLRKPLAIILER